MQDLSCGYFSSGRRARFRYGKTLRGRCVGAGCRSDEKIGNIFNPDRFCQGYFLYCSCGQGEDRNFEFVRTNEKTQKINKTKRKKQKRKEIKKQNEK